MAAAIGLVTLGAAWTAAGRLTFDRRIEGLFPASDPAVAAYEQLNASFGGNAIVLLVYRDRSLFREDGIARAAQIAKKVEAIAGVRDTLTVADVSRALEEIRKFSLSGSEGAALLDGSEVSEAFAELFASYTHNRRRDHGAVVVMLEPDPTGQRYTETIASLGEVADDLPEPLETGVLVGQPVLVSEGFSLIQRDGRRLSRVTVVLLSVVLLIAFRSLQWFLLALLVITWSSIVTRGAAVFLGLPLSLVSAMLTAILMVVAVAALMHLAVRYEQRRRRGDEPRAAAERTLANVSTPIFWACVTDAAGFAALLVSDVGPVRDFGLLMTLGVAAVLVGLALWSPLAMTLTIGRPRTVVLPRLLRGMERRFDRAISRFYFGVLRQRRWLLFVAGVMIALTIAGLSQMQVESNFLRNFRQESSLAKAYQLVEGEFGGAGVWDVLVPAPQGALSADYLAAVRELETRLRDIEVEGAPKARILKTLSMADADLAATQSSNPLVKLAPPSIRLGRMRQVIPTFADALLMPRDAEGPRLLRIMLRSPEDLPAEAKGELIAQVQATVTEHTTREAWQAFFEADRKTTTGQVTGYYVLLARLVASLLADQWSTFLVALVAVTLTVWLATGRIGWTLAALLPNVLPVLGTLSLLGWLGIPLNMGGAMIAAVSIGLTIDGTIHFLNAYRISRQAFGRGRRRSILRAGTRVGAPMLLATLALVIGFSVLTTSPFVPTATFGALLSTAMLLGTATNLVFLPVLLYRR